MADEWPPGEPAFPWDEMRWFHRGMTLRDWLATHAPVSFRDAEIAFGMGDDMQYHLQAKRAELFEASATLCYEYADAMLKVRTKP